MKYNKTKERNPEVKPAITHQGGQGFTQKTKKELIGLLYTGIQDSFYEKENDRTKRLSELLSKVAKEDLIFALKALVYTRSVIGQRSVTHYGAVKVLEFLTGHPMGKKFFSKRNRHANEGGIIYRIDDMGEILALYKHLNGENAPIPNSIKKGFKTAIENADTMELAKYQMKNKSVSLVDIVNLVHPVETKKNGVIKVDHGEYLKATNKTKFMGKSYETDEDGKVIVPTLRALVLGLLKQFDTVEDKNTKVGQDVAKLVKSGEITKDEANKKLEELKTDNYLELIDSKKIGYLALLRNLRNILKLNDNATINAAANMLMSKNAIQKSLVFPHQIDIALEVLLSEFSNNISSKLLGALNAAYEYSIPNLAELFSEGKTAVVLDVSGSMSTSINMGERNKYSRTSALSKGKLIAATLAKGIGADTYIFANSCKQIKINPLDSVHTIANTLVTSGVGGGTYFNSIFPELEKTGAYDRVFIISDEQGADSIEYSYKNYCNKFGAPNTFVINIAGYGTTMLKESTKVHRLYGYTADIYESAKRVEIDIDALIKEINSINI